MTLKVGSGYDQGKLRRSAAALWARAPQWMTAGVSAFERFRSTAGSGAPPPPMPVYVMVHLAQTERERNRTRVGTQLEPIVKAEGRTEPQPLRLILEIGRKAC